MSYSTDTIREVFENAHFINIGFDSGLAYNDLPPLPPAISVTPGGLETNHILKSCIETRVALAELNQLCRHFPLPELLWKIFPLVEAKSSADIEGYTNSVEDLLRLQDTQASDAVSGRAAKTTARPGTKKEAQSRNRVLAIRDSLVQGYQPDRNRRLDSSVLLELCSSLQGKPVSLRRDEGAGIVDPATQEKVYQPPVGAEKLQQLLLNWEQFVNVEAGDLDPLVLIAVSHYQIAAIEPFAECSDTLVRIVDQLLLSEEGLLNYPVLNLSAWFHSNQKEARELLLKVTTEQEWHHWIQFFLKGVHSVTEEAIAKINVMRDLQEHTDRYISESAPKIYSPELIDTLFTEPCTRIHNLVERGIAKRQTASVYLKQLCELDVLREMPFGKEKLFVNHRFVKLVCGESRHYAYFPR